MARAARDRQDVGAPCARLGVAGWCRVHYVTDPEVLFGTNPRYMLDLILNEEDDELWRLLVLEDTGELLPADAKLRTGQGLSRLLNVVDGLIGQGLRILVLVTTNDAIGTLNPAVAPSGPLCGRRRFHGVRGG